MKKLLRLFLNFSLVVLLSTQAFATDWCADANMKMACYYDEASGAPQDCTSNNNDGTVSGVTQNVTGKFSKAVDFTQTNNAYITHGSAASLDNISSLSTGMYVQPDSDGNNEGALCNAATLIGKNDSNNGWVFCIQTTAQLRFRIKWNGGAAYWTTTDTPLTFDGTTWQHLAVTYNRGSTSNDPVIYKDGASRTISEGSSPCCSSVNTDAGYTVYVGLESGANIGEADTRVDEPFIFSGILNSTQVNDIKDNGLTLVSADTYSSRGIGRGIGRGIIR